MDNLSPFQIILITLAGSVIVPIIVSVISNQGLLRKTKIEIKNQFEKKYNEKRWETYSGFLILINSMFESPNASIHLIETNLQKIGAELLLVGSQDTIEAYSKWRIVSWVNGAQDMESIRLLNIFINSMRADLSSDTSELDTQIMLSCIVPSYMRTL